MSYKRQIELTDKQIAFVRESLAYSAEKLRNYDYRPGLHAFGRERRAEIDEIIVSIRAALVATGPKEDF